MEAQPKKQSFSIVRVLMVLIILGGVGWFLSVGLDQQTATQMNKIENQVATDSVAQYQIAQKSGDLMQVCVQAGLVSAAYLQAKDESNYLQWKAIEKSDCKKAGVPR